MTRHPLALPLTFLLPAVALARPPADKAPESPFVAVQHCDLPVILSAPHGGDGKIPGVPERKGEGLAKGASGFFTGRDTNTEQLARELAAAVEQKFGKKPYFVISKAHRRYVDFNRPARVGYEHPDAKPVYDAYHGALAAACRDVQKRFGRGLLLDLHGQGTAQDTVFRGTQHGKTVTLLVQRYGEKAFIGPNSFFGLMAGKGMKVFPPVDSKERERAGFTGGHIVQTYGSHEGYGIDALQLEFGADYRAKDGLKDTAAELAGVIADYSKLYLPAAEQ